MTNPLLKADATKDNLIVRIDDLHERLDNLERHSMTKEPTEIINVKTFGALGDNVTDDTGAIQSALNSLGTNGGTLYFPNGRYKTDTIYLSTDGDASFPSLGRIALVGEQTAFINSVTDTIGSQLIHIDGSSNPLIEIDGTSDIARMVRVENLLLRSGNNTTHIIKTWRCSTHVIFRNLYIKIESSTCNGIYLESSWNVTLDHVTVRGDAAGSGTWTGTGFKIESPASGITSNQLVLSNCSANYMGTGFQIGHRTETPTSNKGPIIVLGGQASNNDQEGFFIGNGVRTVALYGVTIESSYDQGILIDNFARGVSIIDCSFNGNGEGSSVYEIQVGGSGAEASSRIYMRQLEFKSSKLGIEVKINGASMQFIDIDHVTFVPETTDSGTGILIESTVAYNAVVLIGPNIDFRNDFATNINDASYNLGYWNYDNRLKVYSAGETTPDVSNPIPLKHIRFGNSSSTTVTNFINGYRGQMLIISFSNTNTTIQDNANVDLNGANYTPADSSRILVMVNVNDVWMEISKT